MATLRQHSILLAAALLVTGGCAAVRDVAHAQSLPALPEAVSNNPVAGLPALGNGRFVVIGGMRGQQQVSGAVRIVERPRRP